MRRRRRDATNWLYTHRFGPPPLSAMLIFWVSLFPVSQSVEIEIYGISPTVESSLSLEPLQFSARRTVPGETDPLSPNDVVYRLNAAATLRVNVLTSIGRILLLRLDEESRVAFEMIYEGFRTRYIPAYDYLSLLPIIEGKISRQQLHSVLRLMGRISTPYISSYAMLCLESLSDGRVNMELTKPTDLLSGIENDTVVSLAMDKHRSTEIPLSFNEATSSIMKALRKDRLQPDLELVAALMRNLPNFDATNPLIPEAMNYVAAFMKRNSKQNDPILEYLSGYQLLRADQLVREVLERILVSDSASFLVRESVGLLLQNFYAIGNDVEFHEWKIGDLFDVVVQDYYPRNVVAIAKYFQRNFNRLKQQQFDLALYTTELQALSAVIIQLCENPSLSRLEREAAVALRSFVVKKQREEDQLESLDQVGVQRALEYLDAFRSPCLPEKLRIAAESLRPYLNDSLPWNYAFGDTCSRGNPYKLMVNALINMKNIEMPDKLARVLDHFIYHARSSGATGERGILYDHGIIFEREDSDEVELDVYSLLARLPNVFQDKRFAPLLTFFAKPNLIDYLGHRFNMFLHTKPRALLMALLRTASDKPAIRTDEKLYKALRVGIAMLEEPTIVNIYSSEELQNILKILPAVDIDPRYIPIKLLFKKENLFSYISPSFSLTGLESPVQHISLILKTIILKPIDKRLEEAINFALTNLEGPQLPARSYTREDFIYLVNNLFRNNKNIEIAILKSPIYRTVSDWNIAVSGTPENVLARTLSYPIKSLSKDPELSSIIERAEKILEEESPQEIELLNKTTLENMLDYLPETTDLRPVNLLLKKANLAMFLPNRTVSTLENQQPREALIFLLKNLLISPHVKRELSLTKRLQRALKYVEKSTQPAAHDVSSVCTEELLNPLATKYKPLWTKFREFNGNLTVENNDLTFQQFLLSLINDKKDRKLSEAASLALEEIHYGVKSGMIPVIKDTEIIGALSLLPNDPRIDPLKKLLTPSWILEVLPPDFQSTEYPSKEQILRIILLMTKQRPEITENPVLTSAITVAENSLINWKRDVKALRKIVTILKDTLYDPLVAILRPKNLNRLQLNFTFDYRQTSKQLLVGLLHNLMLHPRINADLHIMSVLDAVRQDVLNFGLDSDLLWVLDDADIPYIPSLAPVRLFLHTNMATSRLTPLLDTVNSDVERYDVLLDLLSDDKIVQANQDLRASIRKLKKIEPRFKNYLGISETDIADIFDAIPSEIISKYPDVQNLFSDRNTFENLAPYYEIINSHQPLTMLLLKLGQLPKVTRNESLIAQISELYVALGDVLYNPVILGCDLRPLLRELQHARQINVDYMLQIIDPMMLSVLLPEGIKYDNVQDDGILLSYILEEILAQRVVKSNTEFKTHVSSLYRDLTMILKPKKNKEKNLPNDREVQEMLKFIPRTREYEAIRYLIEKKESFDQIPRSFDWSKYPTPLKKLKKILDFMKRQSENDYYLHKSVLSLDRYLLREYFFVGDNDVRALQAALNELPIDRGSAPLRLFLTVDNLVRYLPSNISIARFKSPNKALIRVLSILRDNKRLRRDELLQNSIATAINAVNKPSSEGKELDNSAIKKSASKLTEYDLRFILNLDMKNEELKNYLNPSKLITILPTSFSFVTKPTFKAKVLHLLKYLIKEKLGPVEELRKIIREVKSFNDLCDINNEDLEPLVATIENNVAEVDFKLVKKYLTVRKLAKILPGNFDIRDNTNTQETLLKLIRALSYGLGSTNVKGILAFEKLLKAMQKPSYSLIKYNPKITLTELKSLIEEIPFEKCKNIRPLRHNMTDAVILDMLPVNLNLTLFKTRKLKLLEILKTVREHPNSSGYRKLVKLAEKCVERMPNVPKLSDRDIRKLLASSDLNQRDKIILSENCKAADLAEYLPIAFDIKAVKSYKKKLKAVIHSCKKLNFPNIRIKIALKSAEIFLARLPAADITRDEFDQIFDEICCCNFTSVKPLILFAAKNDLLSLLSNKLNFHSKFTVKHKLIALITALRNVQQFQNEKMYHALETAEETAHGLRDKPMISEDHIESLTKLPIMTTQQVRPFAKIFVLSNLIKVVPPSFNLSDYEADQTRLSLLLKYSENMEMVKTQESYAVSLASARETLLRKAEKETVEYLKRIIDNVDEHIPLILWVKSKPEREIFNRVKIPHGFEYPKIEDRLRIVLKSVVRDQKNLRSTSLVESLESVISQLSVGEPTDYEIIEAINEIPNSEKNQELKTYLRCKDIQRRAKGMTLTPEHTAKRILLDLLTVVKQLAVDEGIISSIDRMVSDVQRAVWDSEAEELFKEIPNFKLHMARLEAIRFYYISHGPEAIFGANYSAVLPGKLERLEKLVSVLLASSDLLEKVELKTGVEYLREILSNRTDSKSPRHQRTMRDVDIKSLFTVLPKTRSERTILGLLKFFADPELIDIMSESIYPSQYKSQGPLMQEIINFGLTLPKVKNDREQLKALEYVKDKILMTGSGALPVKLNTLSRHSTINPDLIGVLKAVDIRAVNLSVLMPIANFLDTKYNPLIHSRGFDNEAHVTRGTFLKALLEHLMANSDVPKEIKTHAKVLLDFVRLDGPGAAPVDLNENTMPDNRIFYSTWQTDYPQVERSSSALNLHEEYTAYVPGGADIYSHFGSYHRKSHWEEFATVYSEFMSQPPAISLKKLMEKENELLEVFEKERSALRTSVDWILDPNSAQKKSKSAKQGEGEDDDESKWSQDLVKERDTLKNSTKQTLGFVKRMLPQSDGAEYQKRTKHGGSSKRETVKSSTISSHHGALNEAEFDAESATFPPDKILIDVKTRISEGPLNKAATKEKVLITEEEAEKLRKKKRRPIKPLAVDPRELPEPDSEHKVIPHNVSRSPKKVNLESRKLFVRNGTGAELDLTKEQVDASNKKYAAFEKLENLSRDNKTVKKDLSQPGSAVYRMLTDVEGETIAIKNGVTDPPPVSQALTFPRLELSETITRDNITKLGAESSLESKKLLQRNETVNSTREVANRQLTDDLTVEEFRAHEERDGILETTIYPEIIDEKRRTLDQDHGLSEGTIRKDNYDGESAIKKKRIMEKRTKNASSKSANIDVEKLFELKKVPCRRANFSSHRRTRRKAEVQAAQYMVSLDEDYLGVPIAAELGVAPDSSEYGNFHSIYPSVEKMYGEGFRRKRSTDFHLPMLKLDTAKESVNYDTARSYKRKIDKVMHKTRTSRRPERLALEVERP